MTDRSFLRNVGCITGAGLQFRGDVDIAIEDGLVTDIGPGVAHGHGPSLPGALAIPGLINAHTHIGDAALAGRGLGVDPESLLWPPDGLRHRWMHQAGPQVIADGIRAAAEVMLASGTVAFADFRENGPDGVRLLNQAIAGLPLKAVVFGRHRTFPLHTPQELAANTAPLSQERLADINAVLAVADGFSPLWANDTTDAGLTQTAARVRAAGGRLATHAGETPRYRELSRDRTGTGDVQRVIRHLHPDFVVHMTAGTADEFDLLAAADIPVVMCPRTQAVLGHGIPPITTALERGASVALGTDNAMLTPPDLLAEMAFLTRAVRAATGRVDRPTARQVLAAATTAPAAALGLQDTHGIIDRGRPATFFLLDSRSPAIRHVHDPLIAVTSRAAAGDVLAVLVDGHAVRGALPGANP